MKNHNVTYNEYLLEILTSPQSIHKSSRAGDTIGTTGLQMKFDLSAGFPLLNTKKLFFRGIFEELAWFMRGPALDGQMHIDDLLAAKCHFWTPNVFDKYLRDTGRSNKYIRNSPEWDVALQEFSDCLESDPIFRTVRGVMGRPYGAQWRDCVGPDGAIDQLADAYEAIKS